ncbi:hypothetical protein SCP_0401860 [Sparassis crispa]|uniref:Protein kinase domain-containing protein n=1 Tax=Sparassis crispa TaxID=139825 RepID=A0A401GI61_9APHY|nr:hypothetical protein SCP_0401860 [Sparassis crispa]GBE81813.1 hypothetical protein SCP_0401860 [Sparassis crispa]
MAQRRAHHHRISSVPDSTAILTRRKLQSRRGASARRRAFTLADPYGRTSSSRDSRASGSSPPTSARPVLVPLQFNLRRLPSRLFSERKESMRDAGDGYTVRAGAKRKRVVSGSENTAGARSTRNAGRVKRRRAVRESSDEDEMSGMDIDDQAHWESSDNSEDEGAMDSSDDFLIHEADPRQLFRMRKEELVRLYIAAGLTEDAELLTKHEIVDCIVAARDDVAELPPSSPGIGDSNSSDYSSDGGNVAGGEETDFGGKFRNGLRRRATVQDLGRSARSTAASRSLSLGQLEAAPSHGKRAREPSGPSCPIRRRGTSNASSSRSSPTSSAAYSLPSPPATRLRTRKLSNEDSVASTSARLSKGKGKAKQVEFNDEVQVKSKPVTRPFDDESDLTDLTEVEQSIAKISPSPRRLRSKGERPRSEKEIPVETAFDADRRVTPMRKAKGKVGCLREEDEEEEEEEVDQLESGTDQDEEVDQLTETPSPMATPKAAVPRGRWTPVVRRLRPRRIQTHTPPSDGDDEGSENDEGADVETSVDGEDEENEGDDERSVVDGESEEEEEQPPPEPKKLRNGKIVPDGEVEDEVAEEDDDEGDEDYADSTVEDVDAEGETEESEGTDEPMDDDVDLTIATARTLVRLRRDDLVRLCETRDLDASGTKSQLADTLLQWRDRHCSEASSPSSTGTARPPSTAKGRPGRRKTRSKSNSQTPPVLLRSDRVHMDEPRTPPLSGQQKEAEPELELDLESLGLEDREIPPDKLTKLEKIGSGGFKDVFIGKFKGRRVAISEFRSQLSAMDIKELKLLGDFDHPNIVRFLGVSIPENTRETPVMIVSELCSNGDLFDYVRNVKPPSLYRVLCIMLDIARGLEYLHMRKPSVIHRDCKSSNILITSKGIAKITDFGLAKVKQSTRSMVRSLVGTVNWQAPELWHPHPKYNHKVDVFSCGMVYWEMLQWHVLNKKFPWEGMNEHAIYDLVGAKRQRPSINGLRKHWCPEIVDLIERMWAQEPDERPTMSEIVEELEHLVQIYR